MTNWKKYMAIVADYSVYVNIEGVNKRWHFVDLSNENLTKQVAQFRNRLESTYLACEVKQNFCRRPNKNLTFSIGYVKLPNCLRT